MRALRLLVLSGVVAASAATAATAQDQPATAAPGAIGAIDFGGRFLTVDGDPARLQRYRDLRDGAFLDGFRYRRERERWLFEAAAENVGYRDQRYQAAFNAYGKLRTWFEWTQVPLFYSVDTRTAYSGGSAGGVLVLDDQGAAPPLVSGSWRRPPPRSICRSTCPRRGGSARCRGAPASASATSSKCRGRWINARPI
jgi:hypothetical protein